MTKPTRRPQLVYMLSSHEISTWIARLFSCPVSSA